MSKAGYCLGTGSKIILALVTIMVALGGGLFNWRGKNVQADLPAADPDWMKVFPTYPHPLDGVFSLGDEATFNGMPMQMAYLRTADNMEQITSFYQGVWTTRGFEPQVRKYDEHSTSVAVEDLSNNRFLTVNIIDQGETRLIMPVVTLSPEFGEEGQVVVKQSINLPVPDGTMLINNHEMVSQGLLSASKICKIDLSVAESMAFYYKVMPTLGFKAERQSTENNNDILYFVAGKVTVTLTFAVVSEAPPVTMMAVAYLEEP